MRIGAPKERFAGEARVALTPESAMQLQKLGHACLVEAGAGEGSGISDDAYRTAGVTVVEDAAA
ncbi:NAD(P)(+) transhydrogenase (Re/Si-specific) subunit alpha, partial [Shinella granuli]